MIVASFYTVGTLYEAEAQKLISSMDALGIRHSVTGCPDLHSWDLNCKWKPFIILRAMNQYDQDVLYADADATFHRLPALQELKGISDCDIAAHIMDKAFWQQDTSRRKFSLMSGTLFFKNNDAARSLLLDWEQENQIEPRQWDQHNLEAALKFDPQTKSVGGPYRLAELPVQYCAIDRTMFGIDDAIIRHHQASRRLKKTIGNRQ